MNILKYLLAIAILIITSSVTRAQLLKKLKKVVKDAAEQTVQDKTAEKTQETTSKAMDGVFAMPGKIKIHNKKDKRHLSGSGDNNADNTTAYSVSASESSFAALSKYDFVPGEKIVAMEDFSQDAVGDFPAKWNTNASGEIMQVEGSDDHWLALTTKGASTPEFVADIPENATIEFDLAVTPKYSYYSSPLFISIINNKSKNDFANWSYPAAARKTSGVLFSLHPQDAGNVSLGRSAIQTFENKEKVMGNEKKNLECFSKEQNVVHVALWRQKQRLRVYVDETKLWDLPRAFAENINYNSLVFGHNGSEKGEFYLISNIRLAIGEPDTRNKLITEGKFTTTGIHFATGSAEIMTESYGVLKEIANVLKENSSVNIQIIGHTDNVGNAAANQQLSEQRAASVKTYLNAQFGIDNARMTTSGKGDTQPVADNNTTEGRAQNRRVEFIKM
ncbi:hypothetical protein A9P82_14340 [Arachidicoccus ginsenosidimutans]|nr:hypothetical protein A9P82_14340 [Arachidicoccus sp. BS20]